jgi:hypothetical protein
MLLMALLYKTVLEGPPRAPRFVRIRPDHLKNRWLLRFVVLERLIEPRPPCRRWPAPRVSAGWPLTCTLPASGQPPVSVSAAWIQNISSLSQGQSRSLAPTVAASRGDLPPRQGQTERDHDAPPFARSPAGGSAGHRIPPKYLYWSGRARSGGLRRLVGEAPWRLNATDRPHLLAPISTAMVAV